MGRRNQGAGAAIPPSPFQIHPAVLPTLGPWEWAGGSASAHDTPSGDSCSLRPLSHVPPPPATLWHPQFWDLCWAHPKNHPGGIQKDPRVGPDSPHLPPAMPLSFPGGKGSIQQPPNFAHLLGHPPALKGGWTQGKGRLGSRWKPAALVPGASQAGWDFSARFNPSWQVPGARRAEQGRGRSLDVHHHQQVPLLPRAPRGGRRYWGCSGKCLCSPPLPDPCAK